MGLWNFPILVKDAVVVVMLCWDAQIMIFLPHCSLMRLVKPFPVKIQCNEAGMRQMSASGLMAGNEESPNLGLFNARYRWFDKAPIGIRKRSTAH